MTLFYGLLEPDSGTLRYSCAGHPFPLLRKSTGEIVELGQGTLPLGIRPNLEVSLGEAYIEPGDTLMSITDGLPEAIGGARGEAFGFERLQELLRPGGSARQIHDRVLKAFDRHMGEEPLTDDLTIVVVARL